MINEVLSGCKIWNKEILVRLQMPYVKTFRFKGCTSIHLLFISTFSTRVTAVSKADEITIRQHDEDSSCREKLKLYLRPIPSRTIKSLNHAKTTLIALK